jgi:hypothetical protein
MKLFKTVCGLLVIANLRCYAGEVKNNFITSKNVEASVAALVLNDTDELLGYWVGMFKPVQEVTRISAGEQDAWDYQNKINISVDKIYGGSVTGHSIVAGNNRPFVGTIIKDKTIYKFIVKEPGNDKYDGVFEFYIDKNTKQLTGTWKANNKIRISKREYILVKRNFKYDAGIPLDKSNRYIDWVKNKKVAPGDKHYGSDYDISYFTTTLDLYKYNPSVQQLNKTQVANLKKADLFILRNSIYARHGYSFKDQQLRAYFDREPWYIPVSTDVKSDFTEIEKKNIELLMRYEKNAKEYYDVFGRG